MAHASNRAAQPALGRTKTCKTCALCRLKKVRCCGTRPRCAECVTDDLECTYPPDARSKPRPSKGRMRALEATIEAMLDYMKASGIVPSDTRLEQWLGGTVPPAPGPTPGQAAPTSKNLPNSPDRSITVRGTHTDLSLSPSSSQVGLGLMDLGLNNHDTTMADCEAIGLPESPHPNHPTPAISCQTSTTPTAQVPRPLQRDSRQAQEGDTNSFSSLSPGEARVTAVLHDDGCVSSVHGLSSMVHHMPKPKDDEKASKAGSVTVGGEAATAATKARLISYAALQSQREGWIYHQPHTKIDLDGCDPDLAKHLLDLHFNRFHFAYLITYRPAIVDSIASGGGPWVNKLLLNAIYFSSSLFSDRRCLQDDPDDPQSTGARFYRRFCQLLPGELSKSSIPSAVALLLTSACLVSHGRSSAGWNLSGLAYRMVIDLGCHLTLGPDCTDSAGKPRFNDIEQEMRTRLYWGAFAIDATQALYLGRPCMFAPVEARVPICFLDTFEELERWEPHRDPQTPSSHPPAYTPQPAYGVSTFTGLARLFQISTRIIKLYGIEAIRSGTEEIQQELTEIDRKLKQWTNSLPNHLRFDPEGSSIPPPHQILLHSTFHALNILLHRAFFENGHLWHHSNDTISSCSSETCIQSALVIGKYVRCYRQTFTLRNAPFLLAYATFSAVTIILRQERHQRGHYIELISFFWTCLGELQRGTNFGTKKPLTVLKDIVREYEISIKEIGATVSDENDGQIVQNGLDTSILSTFTTHSSDNPPTSYAEDGQEGGGATFVADGGGSIWEQELFSTSTNEMLGCVDGQESIIWQDTLYGLFTSSLPFG